MAAANQAGAARSRLCLAVKILLRAVPEFWLAVDAQASGKRLLNCMSAHIPHLLKRSVRLPVAPAAIIRRWLHEARVMVFASPVLKQPQPDGSVSLHVFRGFP